MVMNGRSSPEADRQPLDDLNQNSVEARKEMVSAIKVKHPNRVPVIMDKKVGDLSLPDVDKRKFLVPSDLTVGQVVYVIRKRIKLEADQAIFLFLKNGVLPPSGALISEIYEKHRDPDGLLYMTYSGENAFGSL